MMRYRFAVLGALLVLAAPAWGQTPATVRLSVGSSNALVSAGNPLPVTGTFTPSGTQAVSLASGAVASGAYASGSIASGAFAAGSIGSGAVASGAVASGAYASGSLASGAMVDLVASQTPIAAASATATKGLLLGGQYDSTQKTLTTGQQAAFSASPRGALFVAVGADGFAVTNAGTFATQSAVTAASGSYASGAFASGSFASGSHASGSFASGAFASGSVASGAYASGSLASGAMVDLVALSAPVAPATATATKSALIGCQATSAGITPTTGQQAALDCDLNNNLLTSPGGAPNYVTSQVSVTTGDTAVASARALRRQIRITNVTGTQQVWCSGTTAAANTAELIPAVVGASLTISTTSAVRCIASTGAQTVTVAEIY